MRGPGEVKYVSVQFLHYLADPAMGGCPGTGFCRIQPCVAWIQWISSGSSSCLPE